MLRANSVRAASNWQGEASDSVVLDYDDRHRRRVAMRTVHGLEFLLDLPEAVALVTGDALALEDGRLIEVVAKPEKLIEIRAASEPELARIAWHLGNRHLAIQIFGKKIRIRDDHVVAEMLRGLGARLMEIEAPFDPEGGAYLSGHHAHRQGHTEGKPTNDRSEHHDHVHSPDCTHGHHHSHGRAHGRT